MKFFFSKSYPSATFIFKVLSFIHKTCAYDEMLHYVNEIWKGE